MQSLRKNKLVVGSVLLHCWWSTLSPFHQLWSHLLSMRLICSRPAVWWASQPWSSCNWCPPASTSFNAQQQTWDILLFCIFVEFLYHMTGSYRNRQNYGKKNVSIYRRRLSMIEKLRTFFFLHNYFFHNYFFFHNSVGDCMSIDSQFECILRGNIEL